MPLSTSGLMLARTAARKASESAEFVGSFSITASFLYYWLYIESRPAYIMNIGCDTIIG